MNEHCPPSRTQRLADFFKARPNQWIDGRDLEFCGCYAWRSRVSNIRHPPFSMRIDNRQRRVQTPAGDSFIVSEYVYRPAVTVDSAGARQATAKGAADGGGTLPAAV